MHAPSYLLEKIKRAISPEILQEAFSPVRYNPTDRYSFTDRSVNFNVDTVIRRIIIDGWLMTDMSLTSGSEATIPLRGLPMEMIDAWNIVYRIPKDRTDGRSISHAYSVSFGNGYSTNSYRANMNRNSPLTEAAGGLLLSNLPLPAVSTAYVKLVEENTVMISDINILPSDMWLRCLLTHEPDFKNIKPSSLPALGKLAILATKAYIHTNLIIPMDEGQIRSGVALNRFREIVDNYSDALELYDEQIETKWRKKAYTNDPETMKRIWKFTVGGRR